MMKSLEFSIMHDAAIYWYHCFDAWPATSTNGNYCQHALAALSIRSATQDHSTYALYQDRPLLRPLK